MKNKNMIILAASAVLSLTIAGAVTDRVKGNDEKPRALWVQMAEDIMESMDKGGLAPVSFPEMVPMGETDTVKVPSATTGLPASESPEGKGDPQASGMGNDPETGKAKKDQSGSIIPEAPETPADPEKVAPETVLPPEKTLPMSQVPGTPGAKTVAGEAGTAPTPVKEPEVSGVVTAPVSEAKPQADAPAPKPESSTPAPAPQPVPTPVPQPAPVPDQVNKGTILQMTTTAENSTTTLQFNYAENFGDGRGITFGIIGFTTGTYDGNELIKHYTMLSSNNSLARFIPALDAIDRLPHTGNDGDSSNSTAGLDGFIQAVQENTDPLFRKAQLDKLDQLYWNPAVKLQSGIGAKDALTQAFLYDMTVNHGFSGAQNFISKATYALGGTPATGIDEQTYLRKLMELRETYLKNTGNPGADRVAAFRRILDTGNVRLITPFSFTVYGDTFRIDGDIR